MNKFQILIGILCVVVKDVTGQVFKTCLTENLSAPSFRESRHFSSNDTMTVEGCCGSCSMTAFTTCGLTEISFCQCTNDEIPSSGAICGDTCLADGEGCGLRSDGTKVDVYDTGSGPPDFSMIVDDSGSEISIEVAYTTSSLEFMINFGDGTPEIEGEAPRTGSYVKRFSYLKTSLPGNYILTVTSRVPGLSSFHTEQFDLQPITAYPSVDLLECPLIREPDVEYKCNVSVTYKSNEHSYTATFDDDNIPIVLKEIGNVYKQRGIPVPKGKIEENFESGSQPADVIRFHQYAFQISSAIIAIDYLPHDTSPIKFEVLEPSCPNGTFYCLFLQTCKEKCPYDLASSSFSCPKAFVPATYSCDSEDSTDGEIAPTWIERLLYSDDGGTIENTRKHAVIQQPFEVSPGAVLQVTGSVSKSNSIEYPGDTVNDLDTGYHHYVSLTVKELIQVPVLHKCSVVGRNVTLTVVDDEDAPNFGTPVMTMCERNITNVMVTISQPEVDNYNQTTKGHYHVRTNSEFDVSVALSVAGPLNLNLIFESNVTIEEAQTYNSDYPRENGPYTEILSRKLVEDGVYVLTVEAFNTHNLVPDDATGLVPAKPSSVVVIHALHVVQSTWNITTKGDIDGVFYIPSNVPTFIFEDPSGLSFPTNATIEFDWGDGTPTESLEFDDPGNKMPNFTHNYPGPDTYTVSALIYNPVSASESLTFSFTVMEEISNFKVTPMVFEPPENPVPHPGRGPDGNEFHMGQVMSLFPSLAAGSVEKYILKNSETGQIIKEFVVTNKNMSAENHLDFLPANETVLNLVLVASNSYQQIPFHFTIKFVDLSDLLKGLQITSDRKITNEGEVKTFFVTCMTVGKESCIVVDFGDETLPLSFGFEERCLMNYSHAVYDPTIPLSLNISVTHIYTEVGMYNATAFGYNYNSVESDMYMFPVTKIGCSIPQLRIIGQVLDYEKSPQLYRGETNTFVAVGNIRCDLTLKTTKRWQIFGFDYNTTFWLPGISIQDKIPSWNKPELIIPPAFLDYGYYIAQYRLRMDHNDGEIPELERWVIQNEVETYFAIIKTPIVAKHTEKFLTRVVRGLGQSILLQPAVFSIDPDFPNNKNFSIRWRCRALGEKYPDHTIELPATTALSGGTGCFGYGPGYLNYSSNKMEIFGYQFRDYGVTYQMDAEVSTSDGRKSFVSLDIVVSDQKVPTVKAWCADEELCDPAGDGKGVYMNPNDRMGLKCQCLEACDEILTYKWKVLDKNDDVLVIPPSQMPLGKNTPEFSLSEEFFDEHPEVKDFRIQIEITNSAYPPQLGYSTYFMKVNQRPIGGNCTLNKYVVYSLIEEVTLTCNGWKDPEGVGIKFYIVRLLEEGEEPLTLIERRHVHTYDQEMALILPVGELEIEVTVIDKWQAETVVKLPNITSLMITREEFLDFDYPVEVYREDGGGDLEKLTMLMHARNSLMLKADWFRLDSFDDNVEMVTEINKLNEEAVSAIYRNMNFFTRGSTEATSGALAGILNMVSNDTTHAFTLDINTRNKIYDILDNMMDSIAKQKTGDPVDMRKLVENIGTMCSGLVVNVDEVTGESNSGNQTRVSPLDWQNVDSFHYDTRITGENMVIPTDVNEIKKTNVKDTTLQYSQSQMERLQNYIENVTTSVLSKQLIGETMEVKTKNNMSISIGVLYNLEGKYKAGKSWIMFPNICPQGNCSKPIGQAIYEWPARTFKAASNIGKISEGTRILEVVLYERDTLKRLSVEDSPEDIFVSIYRTFKKRGQNDGPDFEYVNAKVECPQHSIPIMYSQFNVTKIGSGVNIEIKVEDPDYKKLFVMVMKPRLPTLKNHTLFKMVEDIPVNPEGTHEWFLDSSIVNGTGRYFIGIGEYKDHVTPSVARSPKRHNLSLESLKNVSVNYYLRVYTSGCYFYRESDRRWVEDGLEVVNSSYEMITCKTNHLTSFGSGLFVMPNTIDFNYVFVNLGFTDNLTIYVTLILFLCLFILLLVYAYYTDRKDVEKVGATPLPDNMKNDKYLYEILVFTGNKKEAQTDSTVQFVLFGEKGTSEIRTFGDNKRKIFRKSSVDVFVMAVPKSLGRLKYIRIWHDNTGRGPNASWYLSYIVFRDIQTGQKFEFIFNDWFALESKDGHVERVAAVAGLEEKTKFGHLFHSTSNKSIVDWHLWFSVFMRPPRSRYTRCQRVASCFTFIFLSMLVNAMWYDTVPSKPSTMGLNTEFFNLSPEQIGVGIIGNLIVFPPTFLIIFIFRKSRPRILRESRIEKALERATKEYKEKKKAVKRTILSRNFEQDGSSTTNLPTNEYKRDTRKEKRIKKKKKFTLPWYFAIVGWLLTFICIAVSVFFLLMYGVMFGEEKARKWLSALVISLLSSIIFTQPIKMFLTALVISLICKKLDMDEDDADEDEEEPHLEKDELWMYDGEKSQKLGFSHLDEELLQELREKRKKEIEMWAILGEVIVYAFYIWILLILSYGQRDPSSWYMKNGLKNNFIHEGEPNGKDFTKVWNSDYLWLYLHKGFMPDLRADVLYNGKPPYRFRGFLNDYVSRIMGYATIRQIRTKLDTCHVGRQIRELTPHCSGFTNIVDEENRHFCKEWRLPTNETEDTEDCKIPEFRYETESDLKSLPVWGKKSWYSGGGYVIHLNGTTEEVLKKFDFLQNNRWIDRMTRAVFVEFSVYNAQVNLFGICTIWVEFTPGGGMSPNYRFDIIRLLQHHSNFGAFIMFCEIAFCVFTIYFTVHEFRLLWKLKKKYFDSYWSYGELSLIFVSYSAIVVYVLRYIETDKVVAIFSETQGNGYMRMTYASTLNDTFGLMIAYLVFVGTLKFIKLLRFQKRMGFLSQTLHQCWDDLQGFGIAFGICFVSFVFMFYFLLSPYIDSFAGFIGALETSFSMMMGKFEFNEMKDVNALAPLMFFVFVLSTSWILINLLLSVIIKSFEQVKSDVMSRPNEYEMIDFIIQTFKTIIGMSSSSVKSKPRQLPSKDDAIYQEPSVAMKGASSELPSKVDKFLEYINKAYFGGTLDLNSKDHLKESFITRPRVVIGSDQSVGTDYFGVENLCKRDFDIYNENNYD